MDTKEYILTILPLVIHKYPELRVGQIITNAAIKGGWKGNDVFYADDETLKTGLTKMYDERQWKD